MSQLQHHHRRRRRHFHRETSPGAAPGQISAGADAYPTTVRMISYGPQKFNEIEEPTKADIEQALQTHPVTWVDVTGTKDTKKIEEIGAIFDLHLLALEDVVNFHQLAKVDDYDSYLFIIARMAPLSGEEETDQLSLFLGENFVVSFQQRAGDDLGSVRSRLRSGVGRIRSAGPDALMYSLLDAVIDAYFPLLEHYGEQLEQLEDDTIVRPDQGLLTKMYEIRRRMLTLRRAIWPLREVTNILVRDESHLVKHETQVYLRDCYDHTVQIIDLMESYRELSSGLMDVYLSSVSNRLNEIMKVLTIITTIFIPLSFIAGIYGMNFNTAKSPYNMPELNAYYGYPICILVMVVIAIVQLLYFQKMGWIGSARRKDSPGAITTTTGTRPGST
jgi:magnesium transporter